jgi:hypothetical protein
MAHQDLPGGTAGRRGEGDHPIVVGMGSGKASAGDDMPKLQSRN